jgi:hypothetical protein
MRNSRVRSAVSRDTEMALCREDGLEAEVMPRVLFGWGLRPQLQVWVDPSAWSFRQRGS